ncbi:YceD family protein [Gorillibacterium timonense]|uniref:YceD family protein n=1 Tax=Gorillibacterium timonense TaxID=1689269 RepID=UPI00071CEA39|nr:DUF177 domain-containing protein [Gorillibacterium timonense]
MQINVKELTLKGKNVQLHESMDMSGLLSGRQDLEAFGVLEADLAAYADGNIAVVDGMLKLPVTMVCSRCLGSVQETLSIPFREKFTLGSISAEAGEEQDDLHQVQEDLVELAPYVEEAVWMALPYIPLCKEDCRGLCPECGTNLNERDCGCSTEKIDPRLAGLADLFKETRKDP